MTKSNLMHCSIQGKVQASINEYSPAAFGNTAARLIPLVKRDAVDMPGPGVILMDIKETY